MSPDSAGDDAGGVVGISVMARLDEVESCELGDGVLCCEAVGVALEECLVVDNGERDHQRREEIKDVLYVHAK